MEGMRRDGRPPVGVVPLILHPSFEEKEVYFRPFSRGSRITTGNDDIDAGTSPQSGHGLIDRCRSARSPSIERTDVSSEFLTARSRLRSIAEMKEGEGEHQEKKQDLTMDDLGTLLDDAIEDHANIVSSDGRGSGLVVQSAGAAANGTSPKQSSSVQARDQPEEGSAEDIAEPLTADPKSSFESARSRNSEISVEAEKTQQRESSPTAVSGFQEGQDPFKRRGSLFRRYSSRMQQTVVADKGEGHTNDRLPADSSNIKAIPSPLKDKMAMFERKASGSNLDSESSRAHISNNSQQKAEWSQYQKSTERKPAGPIRKCVRPHRATSTTISNSSLIPLALPEIVGRDSHLGKHDATADIPYDNDDRFSNIEQQAEHVAPMEGLAVQQHTHTTINDTRPTPLARRSVSLQSGRVMARQMGLQPEPSVPNEGTPSLKWSSLQRNAESGSSQKPTLVHAAQAPDTSTPTVSRAPRASVVECRIRDLLAASKQDDAGPGKNRGEAIDLDNTKQKVLCRSIADMDPIDPKRLPDLQVPIDEEARAIELIAPGHPNTPTKATRAGSPVTKNCASNTEIASPIKQIDTATSTPARGRSRKVKQSLSPRGLPYAIEQRFSLSPSRSQSRHGNSGVFVSVEVRNSPDKHKAGGGDHEVIIRASLEPDDIKEESD